MKKKMRRLRSLAIGVLMAVMLTGCGASASEKADYAVMNESYESDSYATDDVYMMNMAEGAPVEGTMTEEAVTEDTLEEPEAEIQESEPQQTNRKLIKNVNLELETETFDELYSKVNEKTEALCGYV